MLGAAPGNVAENVVLETDRDSTVTFVAGAQHSYLGFITLRFAPDAGASNAPHHKHYCLEVRENSGPTIDHCIIRSLSAGRNDILCSPVHNSVSASCLYLLNKPCILNYSWSCRVCQWNWGRTIHSVL